MFAGQVAERGWPAGAGASESSAVTKSGAVERWDKFVQGQCVILRG